MQGFRNDFQEAMEKVDQAYLDELLAAGGESKEETKTNLKPQEPVTSYEEIREMTKKIGRGNREYDMMVIMKFIQVTQLISLFGKLLQINTYILELINA